jgi:hypothetical protein
VQVLPSVEQLMQKIFLVEQGLHTLFWTKYPSMHLVQATFERQLLQPTKMAEQVWQVTLKAPLTRKNLSLHDVQKSALEQVEQFAGQLTQYWSLT